MVVARTNCTLLHTLALLKARQTLFLHPTWIQLQGCSAKWLRSRRWNLDVQNQRVNSSEVLHYKRPCGTNASALSGPSFLQRCLYYCLPMFIKGHTCLANEIKTKKQLGTSFQEWRHKKNGTCQFRSHDAMCSVSVKSDTLPPKFWQHLDNITTKFEHPFQLRRTEA